MSEITRVVRLSFDPKNVETFIKIFEDSKLLIRNFEGCTYLRLMKDVNYPNVFYTYSKWESPQNLENYRNSDLFKSTWAKTKILFDAKPMAFSLAPVPEISPL